MGADSIMLNSAASQNESGEDHVDATFDGPSDFEIGFSATALAEIVAAIPGEKIVMQMMDATKQAMLSSADGEGGRYVVARSEEHTSELQSLMRISYAVF